MCLSCVLELVCECVSEVECVCELSCAPYERGDRAFEESAAAKRRSSSSVLLLPRYLREPYEQRNHKVSDTP